MNEVYILDAGGSLLFVVKFSEDHLVLMARRGWIGQDKYLIKDRTVSTMSLGRFKDYLEEAT